MAGQAPAGLILLTNSKTVLESLGAPGTIVALTAIVLAMVWVALIGWAVTQERRTEVLDEEQPTAV
jgi:hypothetical protein